MIFKHSLLRNLYRLSRLALVLVLWILLGGWKWFGLGGDPARSIKNNHSIHVKKEGMECTDCHEGALEKKAAGMPSMQFCSDCHEENMDLNNRQKCSFCHTAALDKLETATPGENAKGTLGVVLGPKPLKDVKFSHQRHKEFPCAHCHGEIGKDTHVLLPTDQYMPKPVQCHECHAQKNVSTDCQTCHESTSSKQPPPSHQGNWRVRHGVAAEFQVEGTHGKDCLTCHVKTDCVSCHLNQTPKDHTQFWRLQGHGMEAGMERNRCATCHQPETCVRCHSETAPRSHVGNWSATHCQNCHLDSIQGTTEGCQVCHQKPMHLESIKWPSR